MKYLLKNFIFLLAFFSILTAADKKYSIKSTTIESKIYENGIVSFSEKRLFSFQGKYSFVYKIIPKRGYDRLFNIQISVDDVPFLNEDSKLPGTFLIQERKNSYKIIIYHSSSDEDRLFNIEYSLDNPFTIGPNDTQFYWTYLSDEWEKKPGDLFISQTFIGDIDKSKMTIKQERPLRSKKYTAELNDISYLFSSNNFSKQTEMRLKTIFPTSFLTNPSINDKDFSLAGLIKNERERGLAQIFIMLLVLLVIFFAVNFHKKHLKKFQTDLDERKLFTDFPSKDHPVVVNSLFWREAGMGPTGPGVLSTLFELAAAKKLTMQVVDMGWKIFKSKRLKITILNTDDSDLKSLFAIQLIKRLRKFGKDTTFRDVFYDFSFKSSRWTSVKKKELAKTGWVDTSGQNERYRLLLITFIVQIIIVALGVIYSTFIAFLAIIPFIISIMFLVASRLTQEGQEIYDSWILFTSQLTENKLDLKNFNSDKLLQYCLALSVQPDHLKSIIKDIDNNDPGCFIWMYHGDSGYDISSVASMVSDIATTGTAVSASVGGDGGGGGGGGGAGGGGGGGAG